MISHIFEAPTLGIGRLLNEGARYLVPHHQREYSWTEDEIGQLFTDLADAQEEGTDYYFLGLMVVMPSDADYVILDGQQRMATAVIILSAIRSWLRTHGFQRDADQIQSSYIAQRELGEDELHPRLLLNEINNHQFYTFVVDERPESAIQSELEKLKRYDPNRTLLEAVLYCRREINRIAASETELKNAAKKLFSYVTYLRDHVSVVRLTVPSEADAYTVFETLNDRGLDLTVLDLVKNYVFGKAGSKTRLAEAKSRWAQMTATLSNVRGDDFLKVYWTSRYGRTQKAQLFPYIKKRHKTQESTIAFSIELLESAEHYSAIELADDPIWASFSEHSRERIRALRMLRSQSIHPVILAALVKFSHREMERLLWLLEVLIVRYQLIGGGRTGLLEIATAKLASDIYQGRIKTATEAFAALRDIFPSDTQFRESFAIKQERNNTKAQYILKHLEIEAQKRNAKDHDPDHAPKALTVEHIFPKASGPEWQYLEHDDPAFAEDCTFRLGNLTLLGNVNKDLGQKGFTTKKKAYAQSSLILTRELAKEQLWDRATLDARQNKMAELAVSVWRFQ